MMGVETLDEKFDRLPQSAFDSDNTETRIAGGLNPKFPLRPYQKKALQKLGLYLKHFRRKDGPDQLLFHMATGSGKTLLMAASILHLYRLGYRRFLFLVDSTNIIEKTRDNFLNPNSGKFLFRHPIFIDRQRVDIREVSNFESIDPGAVNLLFSTVQGLHAQLTRPRENMLTPSDFARHPVVLISDEAHHINAATKGGRKSEKVLKTDKTTWEESVDEIFRAHPENLLLEFTATAPMDHPEVAQKYRDKVIMDYPLRRFRQQGYSKEVKVLQSDLPKFERALQAMLLSLHRQKLLAEVGLSVKPVVLFKSRTIAESRDFHAEFLRELPHCASRLTALREVSKVDRLAEAFADFDRHGLDDSDLAGELSGAFAADKLLVVDSKMDGETKQLEVNSLEAPSNPFRGVFAVDKLNEGWDVLNLFDIVRLYDVAGSVGKMRRSTMAEAQLIGRGARYWPFQTDPGQVADRRKFDHLPQHPLRVVEELVYHASHNPSYIAELGQALTAIGIRPAEGEKRGKKPAPATGTKSRQKPFPKVVDVRLFKQRQEWGSAFDETVSEIQTSVYTASLPALSLGRSVWKKAFRVRRDFWFDALTERYPDIPSTDAFMDSERFLGGLKIELTADIPFGEMVPGTRLEVALRVMDSL